MILYLDSETTGLRPGQICQLSYIMQSKDKVYAKNYFFTVDNVEYSAYLVHGFSVDRLKVLSNQKRFEDYIEEIAKDLESAGVVVTHNTSFDFMFLRAEFERCNHQLCIKEQFCSMKNSTAICKLKGRREGYKYPKLSELMSHFGISDLDIKTTSKKLFCDEADYHDARFDTTAVYLATNYAIENEKEFTKLKEFL